MALSGSPCKSPILTVQSPRNFGFLKSGTLISTIHISINSQNSIPAVSNIIIPFLGRPNCCISSSAGSSIEADESPSKIIFVKVKIVTDKKTGQSLGFAYVWFPCEECAEMAVNEMNGKFFEGKFIFVTIAKPGSCKPQVKTTTPLKF